MSDHEDIPYSDADAQAATDGIIDADTVDGSHASDLGISTATLIYGCSENGQMASYDTGAATIATLANESTNNWSQVGIMHANDGFIYAWGQSGEVYRYDVSADSWSAGLANFAGFETQVDVTREAW